MTWKLKHFQPAEFRSSLLMMNMELLSKLDMFREALGHPVMISPATGALYRPWSPKSQHSLGRAIDIMLPEGPTLQIAYHIARETGFSGIGLYPDWRPWPGMHLDIRTDRSPDDPALWAARTVGNEQIYGSIWEVITP